jgi:hypothetical protein
LEAFETSASGLSCEEAAARLKSYGPNALAIKKESRWKRLLEPFANAFVVLLAVDLHKLLFHHLTKHRYSQRAFLDFSLACCYHILMRHTPKSAGGELLKAGAMHTMFGVERGQFSNMQRFLLALVMGERSYRFSKTYAKALVEDKGDEAHLPLVAADFAIKPSSGLIITGELISVRQKLQGSMEEFNDRLYVPAQRIITVLNVGRATLFEWIRNEELSSYVPRGKNAPLHISAESLQAFCRWQYPSPREPGSGVNVI